MSALAASAPPLLPGDADAAEVKRRLDAWYSGHEARNRGNPWADEYPSPLRACDVELAMSVLAVNGETNVVPHVMGAKAFITSDMGVTSSMPVLSDRIRAALDDVTLPERYQPAESDLEPFEVAFIAECHDAHWEDRAGRVPADPLHGTDPNVVISLDERRRRNRRRKPVSARRAA